MRAAWLGGMALLAVPLAVAMADPRPDVEPRSLLPDLASLPPDGFTFTAPDGSTDGCLDHEEEQGARRCLRFTTYLTNVGQGPLDLGVARLNRGMLEVYDAVGERLLVQRLHATDGSWQERYAGSAEFHGVHDHFHVAGLVAFSLHAVDGAGVAASNASAAGGKTGFCLFDGAPGDGGEVPVGRRTYQRWNCKALDNLGVGMGITPGWVDRYNWTLADQYLEVSGVPDGDYELTVVADPAHAILEGSLANNVATVRLRIVGQSVVVLPTHLLPTESP